MTREVSAAAFVCGLCTGGKRPEVAELVLVGDDEVHYRAKFRQGSLSRSYEAGSTSPMIGSYGRGITFKQVEVDVIVGDPPDQIFRTACPKHPGELEVSHDEITSAVEHFTRTGHRRRIPITRVVPG